MREDSPLLLCVRCRRLVDLCREDLTPPVLLACNNKDGDDGWRWTDPKEEKEEDELVAWVLSRADAVDGLLFGWPPEEQPTLLRLQLGRGILLPWMTVDEEALGVIVGWAVETAANPGFTLLSRFVDEVLLAISLGWWFTLGVVVVVRLEANNIRLLFWLLLWLLWWRSDAAAATLLLVLPLTTFGATMFNVVVVVVLLLLVANGRTMRLVVVGPLDVDRRVGAGGVETACGILERSGVRFKFNLDPPLELLLLFLVSILLSADFLPFSNLLLLYRVSNKKKKKKKRIKRNAKKQKKNLSESLFEWTSMTKRIYSTLSAFQGE